MLETTLRLVAALNALELGSMNAPDAEAWIRAGEPHHVSDPEQLLAMGIDPLASVPIRQALSRIGSQTHATTWALLLPSPGRLAGLRGPVEINAAALESGAVAASVPPAGRDTIVWTGTRVGAGVQWRLQRAERIIVPEHTSEASRRFLSEVLAATQDLARAGQGTSGRPSATSAPLLGEAYPAASQKLLERAWQVLDACEAGLANQHELISSHDVVVREQGLRRLLGHCHDAIASAVSWPRVGSLG